MGNRSRSKKLGDRKSKWDLFLEARVAKIREIRMAYVKTPGYQRQKLDTAIQANAITAAKAKRNRKAMVNFNRVRTGGMKLNRVRTGGMKMGA